MRKAIKLINNIEEYSVVLILLGLAFVSFVEVICRYVLSFSFTWMEEVCRYGGVLVTFLGASLGVDNDRFRHGLQVVMNVVSGLMFLVIVWYGWAQTMKMYQLGPKMAVLPLYKYWAYVPIPLFSIFISLRFFILGGKHLLAFQRNDPFKMLSRER
jgi:C4-dicarboxylate transporter DctQ subunit